MTTRQCGIAIKKLEIKKAAVGRKLRCIALGYILFRNPKVNSSLLGEIFNLSTRTVATIKANNTRGKSVAARVFKKIKAS